MCQLGIVLLVLLAVGVSGCAAAQPCGNTPLEPLTGASSFPCARDAVASAVTAQLIVGEPEIINTPAESWGLALSGGGTRSAAFAMGVLEGLDNSSPNNSGGVPPLRQFSAISSVSGGGYAAYWYYMRHQYGAFKVGELSPFGNCFPNWWGTGELDKKIASQVRTGVCKHYRHFSLDDQDSYRWQHYLGQRMDILSDKAEYFEGNTQADFKQELRKDAISIIADSVSERIANWFRAVNDRKSPLMEMYVQGIERSFGLEPEKRATSQAPWTFRQSSSQAADGLLPRLTDDPLNHLPTLSDAMKRRQLPLWIMSMAADSSPQDLKISKLFEVTPFGYGSEYHGYVSGQFPVKTLSESVAMSGAVFDRQAPPIGIPFQGILLRVADALNLTWGRTIAFEGDKRLHLSDGGHVENLGVYPLLRRGIKNIVIADGSYDRDGRMDDLCRLRFYLTREGMTLRFPTLPHLAEVCEATMAAVSVKKSPLRYDVYRWAEYVHRGTVEDQSGKEIVKLFYLKLAWDQDEIQGLVNRAKKLPAQEEQIDPNFCRSGGRNLCMLGMYLAHNANQCEEENERRLLFPHFNTFRITANASTPIYWGLKAIGENSVARLLHRDWSNEVSAKTAFNSTSRTNLCKWKSYEGFSPKPNPQHPDEVKKRQLALQSKR